MVKALLLFILIWATPVIPKRHLSRHNQARISRQLEVRMMTANHQDITEAPESIDDLVKNAIFDTIVVQHDPIRYSIPQDGPEERYDGFLSNSQTQGSQSPPPSPSPEDSPSSQGNGGDPPPPKDSVLIGLRPNHKSEEGITSNGAGSSSSGVTVLAGDVFVKHDPVFYANSFDRPIIQGTDKVMLRSDNKAIDELIKQEGELRARGGQPAPNAGSAQRKSDDSPPMGPPIVVKSQDEERWAVPRSGMMSAADAMSEMTADNSKSGVTTAADAKPGMMPADDAPNPDDDTSNERIQGRRLQSSDEDEYRHTHQSRHHKRMKVVPRNAKPYLVDPVDEDSSDKELFVMSPSQKVERDVDDKDAEDKHGDGSQGNAGQGPVNSDCTSKCKDKPDSNEGKLCGLTPSGWYWYRNQCERRCDFAHRHDTKRCGKQAKRQSKRKSRSSRIRSQAH